MAKIKLTKSAVDAAKVDILSSGDGIPPLTAATCG